MILNDLSRTVFVVLSIGSLFISMPIRCVASVSVLTREEIKNENNVSTYLEIEHSCMTCQRDELREELNNVERDVSY